MIRLHKLIASVFGVGYAKGGGTYAAIVCCVVWILIPAGNFYWQVFFTLLICAIGVWSSNVVDALWGKDSSKVVIDEVAGMMITLLAVPVNWKYVATGLVLFRFFDIAKPLYVRSMEKLPKGWGVMADDVLAGVYAHVVLSILLYYEIF